MNLTDFIAQAHPATLDWLEDTLMDQLLVVDNINKKLGAVKDLRRVIEECASS
jgi:hypothetical protein